MADPIDLDSDGARIAHIYANYLEVGHNAAEFVLAFGTYNDGDTKPRIYTHIHTSPAYARAFFNVLGTALEHYERGLPTSD